MGTPASLTLSFTIRNAHPDTGFHVAIKVSPQPGPDQTIRGIITTRDGQALLATLRRMVTQLQQGAEATRPP